MIDGIIFHNASKTRGRINVPSIPMEVPGSAEYTSARRKYLNSRKGYELCLRK